MADAPTTAAASEIDASQVQPRFRRDPEVGITYAPLIDVRTSQYGLHLLTFVPPAATPDDLQLQDGQPIIELRASSEVLVPLSAVERLIRDLSKQLRATLIKRLKQDAAANGLEVDEASIEWAGLQDIMAVADGRQQEG